MNKTPILKDLVNKTGHEKQKNQLEDGRHSANKIIRMRENEKKEPIIREIETEGKI